jgi:hypothetical protein
MDNLHALTLLIRPPLSCATTARQAADYSDKGTMELRCLEQAVHDATAPSLPSAVSILGWLLEFAWLAAVTTSADTHAHDPRAAVADHPAVLPPLPIPLRPRPHRGRATRAASVEAEAVGDRSGLDPAGDAELGKQVGDVDAGGLGADEQRLGDLAVAASGRD